MKNLIFTVGLMICLGIANSCVAQTSGEKAKSDVANEERMAKEAYALVSGKKKKKRFQTLDCNYATFGLSYIKDAAGNDAPYKNGMGFDLGMGFPIIKKHLLLDWQLTESVLFSANAPWFGRAFGMSPSNLDKSFGGVGFAYASLFQFGVSPVVINKRKFAMTAGGFAGLYLALMPDMFDKYGSYGVQNMASFCYGVKSNIFIGDNFTIAVQYTLTPSKALDVTVPKSSVYAASANSDIVGNFSALKIGVGLRLNFGR